MGDKKALEKTDSGADPELDELLDSALEDFSKKPAKESQKDVAKIGPNSDAAEAVGNEPEWTDEFIKQAASQFESNMASLLGGASNPPGGPVDITPEQLQQNFKKMAEAAAQVMANPQALEPTPQSNDFASAISQTLQNLSVGAENLQSPFSDEDLFKMFGSAPGGSGSEAGEQNAFLPFMQGMMQSLLSKEVLYPSLKDILDRYPAWLEDNRATLEASDLERYTKQMELMKNVCNELEKEVDEDSDSTKRDRFDKVLVLMQKMQDLGHPPTELVGETNPGLQFDAQGNPILPPDLNMADPNQCTLM